MKISRADILEQMQLNTLPEVYYRLTDAINNPTSDIADIATLVSEDPALTARLLRIANSAMFNFPSPIDTISQAVTVIGTQQLRDLTLACNLGCLFPGIPPAVINVEQFWRHSIATGICARAIATLRRENNIERFYITGLLHDLGRLIIYSLLPDYATKVLKASADEDRLLIEIEEEHRVLNHADISALLLEHWQLPQSICEPVKYHHNPSQASNFPEHAATIHLADIIAHAMQLGSSGTDKVAPLNDAAWSRIGLSAEHLETLFERVEQQYEEAVSMFLPGGKP